MITTKLKALRGLFQEIADDPDYSKLNSKLQDTIEDMTYEIPIQVTLLQEQIDAVGENTRTTALKTS